MTRIYAAIAAVLIGFGFLSGITEQAAVAEAKEGLEEKVIRFHVLANSDEKSDQELKLKVRDSVLKTVGTLQEEAIFQKQQEKPGATPNISRNELEKMLEEHLNDLQTTAKLRVIEEGYDYPVKVSLETTTFPMKVYGDVAFPAGDYEALRVVIGEGKGHNWWCSLYPSLCFIDATHPVMEEQGREELKAVLTEEEQQMVTMETDFQFDFNLKRYFGRW